jgi:hypothetical protein
MASWWRTNFQTVPRLARILAFVGGVLALPLAALGVFAGDLAGIAAVYVFGDNGFVPGLLFGFFGFAAGSILGGAWIGAQVGKWIAAE